MKIYRVLVWNKSRSLIGKYDYIDGVLARFQYDKLLYEDTANWTYLALIRTDLFSSMLDTFDLIASAKNMGVIECR